MHKGKKKNTNHKYKLLKVNNFSKKPVLLGDLVKVLDLLNIIFTHTTSMTLIVAMMPKKHKYTICMVSLYGSIGTPHRINICFTQYKTI